MELSKEEAPHPPGCNSKLYKKLQIFIMESWVGKFTAFRLVEVFYRGPEGEIHQYDCLTPGLEAELGSPRWGGCGFPRSCGMPHGAPAQAARAQFSLAENRVLHFQPLLLQK